MARIGVFTKELKTTGDMEKDKLPALKMIC